MSRIKDYLIDIEEGRLVPGDLGDKCVCSEHFLDKELQGVIKQEGHRGKCSYCGERRTVINMPDFVRLVREKLESEFEDVDNAMLPLERTVFDDDEDDVPYFTRFHGYAAPSDSEMHDDTGEVITELLEITAPEALFNDVVGALPEHGWISQDPFVATLDDELNIKWKHFAEMVKHKQRFTFLANKEFEGLPSKYLKSRVLNDILSPEFQHETPKGFFRRICFKYHRWKANEWKHQLCYSDSMWSAFWSGVWSHLLKPSSI